MIVAPPPSPPPASSSPPPPSAGSPVFGALGQTASRQFTTLGFGYSGVEVGGFGDLAIDANSLDADFPIALRFAAPAQLLLALGGLGEGILDPSGASGTDGRGRLNHLA